MINDSLWTLSEKKKLKQINQTRGTAFNLFIVHITDPTLRSLAGEVVELLKKTVGLEKFTEVYASTQKVRAERRDMRKQKKAIQV